MAGKDFKYLNRRTTADKVLCNKAFAKKPKYDGYQLLILLKKFQMSLIANQIKYPQKKAAKFTTDQ